MKILTAILILLVFTQGYFLNNLSHEKTASLKEYEDAILAISYHEKKNAEMMKEVQFAKNKNEEIDAKLSAQKIAYTELKTKNDGLTHTINQIEQRINSQKIFIQQKDNEILVLKNELLKYLSE